MVKSYWNCAAVPCAEIIIQRSKIFMDKVKVAIFGTGGVAHSMARAMSYVEDARLYAVASIDDNESKKFAEEFDIPNALTYDEAIADSNIDLCYIALPNIFHFDYSKKCLLAGKNVLCEKPLCINSRQAEELYAIAKEKGVFFSDNMWTRFLPAVKTVKKLIDEGGIGEIHNFSASMAGDFTKGKKMPDPNHAGGILLDCGIYVLTSMDLILGRGFEKFETTALLSERGVDLRSTTVFSYPGGLNASIFLSMDTISPCRITVAGSKGYVDFACPYNWQDINYFNRETGERKKIEVPKYEAGGYEFIAGAICKAIKSGKTYCDECKPTDTLYILGLMDTLREKWGLKYPME